MNRVNEPSNGGPSTRRTIVIVPGLLTESFTGCAAKNALLEGNEAKEAATHWYEAVATACGSMDCRIMVYDWPRRSWSHVVRASASVALHLAVDFRVSGPVGAGALATGRAAFRFLAEREAFIDDCDQAGSVLSSNIDALNDDVVVIGHRAGARVALLASQRLKKSELRALFLLAPAVGTKENAFGPPRVRKGSAHVVFSAGDWAYKVWFHRALPKGAGVGGVGLGPPEGAYTSVSTRQLMGEDIWHTDYAKNLPLLLCGDETRGDHRDWKALETEWSTTRASSDLP